MTSLRSSRSLSNLQVNSLRFNQQDLPAGGGFLTVGPTGTAAITNSITVSSIDVSSINVADLNATTIDVSDLSAGTAFFTGDASVLGTLLALDVSAATLSVSGDTNMQNLSADTADISGLTAGTATFTGDITAQDITVLGTIQALDVSARYFDISGLKVGENLDVSGELRVDLSSTFAGPATFLNTIDASGQQATFGSATIQTDLSAASLYVSGGTTLQDLSAASLYVSGQATFDTATMDTLTVRDIYIQNQIVDVSLGQITQLLIDNVLTGSGGVTTHAFATGYSLDVSGGLRVGHLTGTYLRITPGLTGWTTLEPLGATSAGISMSGSLDVSGSVIERNGLRVLTPSSQTAGPSANTTVAAGYIDTNALRIFTDNGGTGATLGQLTLPAGNNGAALVWNNAGLGGGSGNAQIVVGTGNGGTGKFNVYTGITQNPVPIGILPQMSLDAAGNLTLTGGTLSSSSTSGFSTKATDSTGNGYLTFHTTQTAGTPTERLRIDQNGYISVSQNTVSPQYDSRFDMKMGPTVTTNRFRLWSQQDPNSHLTGNIGVANTVGLTTPIIKFDATDQALYVTNSAESTKFITVSNGGNISVTANNSATQSNTYNMTIQNAPNYNQIKIGTNLSLQTDSPLVSAGDMGIIFNRAGTNTGNLVLGLQTGVTGAAIGMRISDTGLVYIGQNVQVPGSITGGSITSSGAVNITFGNITADISPKIVFRGYVTSTGNGSYENIISVTNLSSGIYIFSIFSSDASWFSNGFIVISNNSFNKNIYKISEGQQNVVVDVRYDGNFKFKMTTFNQQGNITLYPTISYMTPIYPAGWTNQLPTDGSAPSSNTWP
jgi:hypothetical protein